MRHSVDFLTDDLRPQLKSIFAESNLTIRQLSAICGINKSRLSALLNSKAPLTVPDLQVLGLALDFDPRDLIPSLSGFSIDEHTTAESVLQQKAAKVAKQLFASAERQFEVQGDALTIDTMLRWYLRNGGRLVETDQIDDHIAVFPAPKPLENILIPERIGGNALAARSLNTRDPQQVGHYVASLDADCREDILFSYTVTEKENTWKMFEREVLVDFPNAGPKFSLNYATLLMPVVAANHDRLIVNFSVLLSTQLLDQPG